MLKPRVATADLRSAKPPEKVADDFYKSIGWRHLLAKIIKERGRRCEDPLCKTPHGPFGQIYGDHIIERRDDPSLELVEANVLLRCAPCHGRKTAEAAARRNAG